MNDPDILSGLVLFFVLAMFGCGAITLTRNHRDALNFQTRLFIYAVLVRFLMAIVIYQFGLVSVLGDEDAIGWSEGIWFYRQWQQNGVGIFELPSVLTGAFEGNHRGYYFLTATLFYFTGATARLPAAALNCFFGGLTVVFT